MNGQEHLFERQEHRAPGDRSAGEAEGPHTGLMPPGDGKAGANADENSNFDQYSAIKQTKLQNNLTGPGQTPDVGTMNLDSEMGTGHMVVNGLAAADEDGQVKFELPIDNEEVPLPRDEEGQLGLRPNSGELVVDGPLG